MKDIREYLDYRDFLHDLIRERKAASPRLSLRSLARTAGFKSSGFLSEVLDRKRRLTPEAARRLAAALGLNPAESAYFSQLVAYNQAPTLETRNLLHRQLQLMRNRRGSPGRKDDEWDGKSWRRKVLHDLLGWHGFSGDAREEYFRLGRMFQPAIGPREARRLVEWLAETGLIARDAERRWRPSAPWKDEAPAGLALENRHAETLELARSALDRAKRGNTEMEAKAFAFSPWGIEAARLEIAALFRRLEALAVADAAPDTVQCFSIQMFPLTRPPEH
jgi:uncharacterized protein (TIGR02147 family)